MAAAQDGLSSERKRPWLAIAPPTWWSAANGKRNEDGDVLHLFSVFRRSNKS